MNDFELVTMKVSEVREDSVPELEKKIRDVHEELLQLHLRKHSGQLENVNQLRLLRRDIARMETVRQEKLAAHAAS